MKFKSLITALKSKSFRYIRFRSWYELSRRSGLLARKFPTHPKMVKLPSLVEWRESGSRFLFSGDKDLAVPKKPSEGLRTAVQRMEKGELRFFSTQWFTLGLDYDWVTNPLNGYHYDQSKHWTKVDDFSRTAGDIKFIWEASRFCWLQTIVRNDWHNGEDHSGFVFSRILDWIDRNPLNCGPNYKCSQETSLRVLNWLFALYYYRFSPVLTNAVWDKIIMSIYWQVHHVNQNIDFSRIAVRNNHAVTETLTLYLTGLLFPCFPGTAVWRKRGKEWFEQEIEYQFEPDGTYIQNSMNYQRVVVQLLTIAFALAHKNGERFRQVVYDRAYACVNFLFQCQDDLSGRLPNYGANDGALFFQLDDADYADFRPQLDALYYVLTGKDLYPCEYEDRSWYGTTVGMDYPELVKQSGLISFRDGGYYLVRDTDSLIFVRCGVFKDVCTPDQLHIDWWKDGIDVLMDAGSYLYNTDDGTVRYFSGTASHNTVMLGDYDQMKKGIRFVWTDPSEIVSVSMSESPDEYVLAFVINSFRYLGAGYRIERTLVKKKGKSVMTVSDTVSPDPRLPLRQIWHTLSTDKLEFLSDGCREEGVASFSRYYGRQCASSQVVFSTIDHSITTTITIV